MATVGNLRVKISADASRFRKDMRTAAEEVRRVESSMKSAQSATSSTTATIEDQGTTATSAAKGVAKWTAQHAAAVAVLKGAEKAVRSNTAATAALTSSVGKVSGALASATAATETFNAGVRTTGKFILTRLVPPIALLLGAKGIAGLIERLTEFGAQSSEVAPVSQAFDNLAAHVGTTGESLRTDLRGAVVGTVSDLDLMKSSVIALNSEAIKSPEVLTEIAQRARTLGRTVGEDASDSFDRIVRAIGLMNPQLLKQLGVLVSVEEATRKYADAQNRTVSSLTEAERKTAFLNEVMGELRAATGRVGDETDDLGTIMQQNEAAQENFRVAMQTAVAEAENIKLVNKEWTQLKTGIIEMNQSILPGLAHNFAEIIGLMGRMVTQPLVEGGPGGLGALGLGDVSTQGIRDYIERTEEATEATEDLGDAVEKIILPGGSGGFDALPSLDAFGELRKEMRKIEALSGALGDQFDATAAKQHAIRTAIEGAIADGWDPASDKVQELVGELRGLVSQQEAVEEATRRAKEELQAFVDISPAEVGTFGRAGGNQLAAPRRDQALGESRSLGGLSGSMDLQGLRQEIATTGESLGSMIVRMGEFRGETESSSEELRQVVGGIASFADGLGLLDGSARTAVRGVSDAVSGIDSLQNASGTLGKIAGGAAVAGAVIGLGRALLNSGEAAAQARREFESAMQSLREFGQASTQLEQDMDEIVSRTADAIERATETMGFEDVDLSGAQSMEDLQAFVDQMDEMAARFRGIDSASEEFQQALAAAEEAMRRAREEQERREQQLRDSIAVRRLEAQGMDEAAAAMQRRLEKEQEIADAREQGFSEETIAALRHVQALEDAARARREEQRAMEEQMEQRRKSRRFGLELQEREAAAGGDERGALEARLQMQAEQELFEAGKLVEAGVITSEQFRRLAEVLEAEANQALEEHTRQIERQAAALAQANASFEQNIALEELRLQGKDREAEILQRQIRFEKELQDAREAGIDEELIERRKEQQERILDEMRRGDGGRREAEESAERGRAARGAASSTVAQTQRISSTQASRMSDILTSISVWTRETAINTRPIRGGRDVPLGQVGARAPSGGTVVNVTLRGDVHADNIQDVDRFMRRLGRTVNEALGRETEREERMQGSGRVR